MAIVSTRSRRIGPGVGVVVVVLAGLAIATLWATESSPQADDFYYFDSAPVHLNRSQTEVVVRFAQQAEAPNVFRRLAQQTAGLQAGLHTVADGRTLDVLSVPEARPAGPDVNQLLQTLRKDPGVEFVAPVFHYPATGIRILPTDEVIVRLKAGDSGLDLASAVSGFGLSVDRAIYGTSDQFVLRLTNGKGTDSLEISRALHESGRFLWAEPNFVQEYQRFDSPNDPLFANQWHLNNTGQDGGTVDADSDLVEAWDIQPGSTHIIIAVLDDGLDKTHQDLAAALFVNPGETAGNSIDDDGNGLVDDVSGWDFSNFDNNVTPSAAADNHGTAVAGVAAARGNNAIGVTGACQNCRILPVKIFENALATTSVSIANALYYAKSFADVINNSWGGGAPSDAIQTAIASANTTGRGGKGSVVLFASGDASRFSLYSIPGFAAGNYGIQLVYSKNASIAHDTDTSWVAWVELPGGEIVDFSGGIPAGWTTGGHASWTVVTDPLHTDEGVCLTKSAKAGTILDNQSSYLQILNKAVGAGTLHVYQWTSSQVAADGLKIKVDFDNNGTFEYDPFFITGVVPLNAGVNFPAFYPESIAVGASSNMDCRSAYSQTGPQLAFVAPSDGGPRNLGIVTTDRTGAAGYDAASNYTSSFGGTSSATPLAAGIAGLILSRSPNLTRARVLDILKNSAEKIGPEPYVSRRNDRYGHGRLNAYEALLDTPVAPGPPRNPVATAGNGQASVAFVSPLSNGGSAITSYTVTSTPGGLTSSGAASPRVVTGLTNQVSYTFRVTATNEAGTGPASAISNSVVPTAIAPTAFNKITPANGAVAQPLTLVLLWGTSSLDAEYEYCIDTSDNDACNKSWISTGIGTGAILSGLLANTSYYWHVRATNGGGTTYSNASETAFHGFTTIKSPRVDLNGDGNGDVFTYNPATGAWARQLSQVGGGFTTESQGSWAPGWSVVPAHFNADGLTDFFLSNSSSGQWFRLLNDGTGFTTQSTGYWWPGWQKFVLELNGDGFSDVFLYDPASGQWYKCTSSAAAFTYSTGYWTPGWEITLMNLNRDAFTDLFLMDRNTGQWYWVLGEAGGGFTYPQVGYWAPDWALYPGDFNGDGRQDLFLYRASAGQYYVARNSGAGYLYTAGYGWAAGWTPHVGDFDGDGSDDLFLYSAANGQWFEMISDGLGGFSVGGNQWWSTGWQFSTADFNGDHRTDFLLYDPASGVWYQARDLILGSFSYNNGFWAAGLTIIIRPPFY